MDPEAEAAALGGLVVATRMRYDARMAKPPRKLSDQIRWIVREAPVSRYALAKESGVDEGNLSRFVSGKAGLSLDGLDKLAQALDLRVVAGRKRKPG